MQRAQVTADAVVEQTLAGVRRKKLYVVLGRKSRWLWRLKRWIPTQLLGTVAKEYRQAMRRYTADD